MPPTKRPPQNQRQRPFKVPRRQTSPEAGPSNSSKPKPKPKTTTKSPKNATASSSKSKPASSSRKNNSRADSKSPTPYDDDADAAAAAAAAAATDSELGSDAGSPFSNRSRSRSGSRERSASGEPDFILAEITNGNAAEESNDVTLAEPEIPPKLLTRLLHTHFQNPKTKIAKDANAVVAKYMDVFVREALARAAFERAEVNGEGASFADGFLEVEDLEKMAPQLVLDF
ncbi:CENP-X/MHF2 family protein [Aspergillus melleus]|uniref:CENP-X/MHF2 family protein n=1 Tax=Aspergillus melleus TaxID=138277 RepID=UPI001E8E1708|nr:uncharacterized protein LDX57_011175 [Aspergillus melleus]KAH8433540.1 hypothetical protein LDX57_011175 [Aspergillus melleus]